ncbi:SAM-dependent methyltransferase [Actinocorallia aurantiaca]|jgi:cyclopropane-fatty-acyl-phospholipid synthase|uniref:Cyclopropane-fatty-acyl-phospholipid synthase family protein n=1 Tax=Actinocorallia aurantiaca TaxID=46204 RepID=A0ABP6GLE0_9ACTN
MVDGAAGRLEPLLTRILGDPLPVGVRAWDGSGIGPAGTPVFVVRDRRALRRLLWRPGEIGLVRAYVTGELDIEGDVCTALGALQRVLRHDDEAIRLSGDDKREIVRTAVMLGAVGPEPKAPPEEGGKGLLEDTPEELYSRMAGDSRALGAGRWAGATTLAEAQRADEERIAAGLALEPGASVLELNAGWASFSARLAREYGAEVTAVTSFGVTPPEGVRVLPFVPAEGSYDVIVALAGVLPLHGVIGELAALLRPGGRLLVRQPVHRRDSVQRPFTSDYVFGSEEELPTLGSFAEVLDAVGLEVRGVTALREDYARTLRAWAAGLQQGPLEDGRARTWLLHLATTALAAEAGRIGLYELDSVLR